MMHAIVTKSLWITTALLIATSGLYAEDWPQWMGKDRDGRLNETGLVDSIPPQGLKVVWRAAISNGYAGPAVAQGKVFVFDFVPAGENEIKNDPSARSGLKGAERLLCLNEATGEKLWEYKYEREYLISYPNGPRATPTVDGSMVYILGAEGDLSCLTTDSGNLVWRKHLPSEYQAETPLWGYAAHPLVYKDSLICLVGGTGSIVVAFDKLTGKEKWRGLNASEIGYCPPMVRQVGGNDQLIVWTADSIHGMSPDTGKEIWSYPLKPKYGMAIAAPQFSGPTMYASGIGDVAALVEMNEAGEPKSTRWTGRPKRGLYSANATPLYQDGVIYGADCETGQFIAVDSADGKRLWETFELTSQSDRIARHGTAFIVQDEDKSWIFSETGMLHLAKLSRDGFQSLGRMQVLEPTSECFGRAVVWSHPAFANRCLFARNDKEIVCVNLAAVSN